MSWSPRRFAVLLAAGVTVFATALAPLSAQASPDDKTLITVLRADQPVTDGSDKTTTTIDMTPALAADKTVCLRVADAFPDDGCGGRVYHLGVDIGEN